MSAENEARPIDNASAVSSDSTIVQTFDDLREKQKVVRNNGLLGKKRGPYKKRIETDGVNPQPGNSPNMGNPGFTEDQITKAFQGLHSMVALSTNCNVWFLSDDEAKCFIPSATSAFNQCFPQVAQSKWGAVSLAVLCYSGVIVAKTLVYLEYKRQERLKALRESEGLEGHPGVGPNA